MRRKASRDSQTLLQKETKTKRPFWRRRPGRTDSSKRKAKSNRNLPKEPPNEKVLDRNAQVSENKNEESFTSSQAKRLDDGEKLLPSRDVPPTAEPFLHTKQTQGGGSAPEKANSDKKLFRAKKVEKHSKARAVLSRSFGRHSLPTKLSRKWVVEVSPAEWDADENVWKYRILVQRRSLRKNASSDETVNSFTTAFTWRTLADFVWLEHALRAEFHGALLLPLLSIAIGTPNVINIQYEVDAPLLQHWLGDVLNGIRGQGELLLDQDEIDLIGSEAVEAFLYRNTESLHSQSLDGQKSARPFHAQPQRSLLDSPWRESPVKEVKEASFVESLWTKPFACLPMDSICAVENDATAQKAEERKSLPLEMVSCQSRALGDATSLEVKESFSEVNAAPLLSTRLVIHSDVLEAQRALAALYRKRCLSLMDKLRTLSADEVRVGAAWKRFAISLSNLFSYEKEVENSRVSGKNERKKDNEPSRKLSKGTVDELLRVLAGQKYDRSVPSLRVLETLLGAFAGDLSAVNPALNAYLDAMKKLSLLDSPTTASSSEAKRTDHKVSGWKESLSTMSLFSFLEVKKTPNSFQTTTTAASTSGWDTEDSQKRAYENRVLLNEKRLRHSLGRLCCATPLRCARMAYKYFNAEASQATLLSSAAISLRTKINVADKGVFTETNVRNEVEAEHDDNEELELVRKILNITNVTKFSGQASTVQRDDVIEPEKAMLRTKALDQARSRLGRWDAKLALAIMEAVGIDDAEVQVEETTRDLRLVRRHAIGLRENLARCVEAVAALKSAIEGQGQEVVGQMSKSRETPESKCVLVYRHDFIDELTILLSGSTDTPAKPASASPSVGVLLSAGIKLDDPAGWLTRTKDGRKGKARCGLATISYANARDATVEKFIENMSQMLTDYQRRVESIESFVYMHCVGIQLEKHFSKKRAAALEAFEKKTDITTAINIATKKRLPLLVQELQAKLAAVRPNVTHTTVKESKEIHLLSKNLKTELGVIAMRRFQRARENALEQVIGIMTEWARYEEVSASKELKALGKAVEEVERSMKFLDISADGISHVIAKRSDESRS